jgi:hypothetical protein
VYVVNQALRLCRWVCYRIGMFSRGKLCDQSWDSNPFVREQRRQCWDAAELDGSSSSRTMSAAIVGSAIGGRWVGKKKAQRRAAASIQRELRLTSDGLEEELWSLYTTHLSIYSILLQVLRAHSPACGQKYIREGRQRQERAYLHRDLHGVRVCSSHHHAIKACMPSAPNAGSNESILPTPTHSPHTFIPSLDHLSAGSLVLCLSMTPMLRSMAIGGSTNGQDVPFWAVGSEISQHPLRDPATKWGWLLPGRLKVARAGETPRRVAGQVMSDEQPPQTPRRFVGHDSPA